MAASHNSLIEFKPGIGGLKVDVFEILRRLIRKKTLNPVHVVPKRFLQIFHDHGVATTQIPRFVPRIPLEKLQSNDTLLSALSNEILDETSKLFGVRRSWFEGQGEQIYDCCFAYQDLCGFFEDIKSLQINVFDSPLAAFCSGPTLDFKSDLSQPIVLVLREKCGELGEQSIYRYRVYGDDWDWSYWKTRIQLKSMVRIWDKTIGSAVPIFRTSLKTLESVRSGNLVPHAYYQRGARLKTANLEDFSLSPVESAASREVEEMLEVLEYVRIHKLEERAFPKT